MNNVNLKVLTACGDRHALKVALTTAIKRKDILIHVCFKKPALNYSYKRSY